MPFEPGKSGNPQGRRAFDTIITDALALEVRRMYRVIDGVVEARAMTPLEGKRAKRKADQGELKQCAAIIAEAVGRQAREGNMEAVRFITERLEGKAVQPIDQNINVSDEFRKLLIEANEWRKANMPALPAPKVIDAE